MENVCPKCGAPLKKEGSKFCQECGANIEAAASQPPASPPPANTNDESTSDKDLFTLMGASEEQVRDILGAPAQADVSGGVRSIGYKSNPHDPLQLTLSFNEKGFVRTIVLLEDYGNCTLCGNKGSDSQEKVTANMDLWHATVVPINSSGVSGQSYGFKHNEILYSLVHAATGSLVLAGGI